MMVARRVNKDIDPCTHDVLGRLTQGKRPYSQNQNHLIGYLYLKLRALEARLARTFTSCNGRFEGGMLLARASLDARD